MSPMAPQHPCCEPGCPVLLPRGVTRCPGHAKQYDQRRGTSLERGYTSRWARLSRQFRANHPWCGLLHDNSVNTTHSWCARDGYITVAQCVQHLVPHQGADDPLFYDETNLMSSCHRCNNKHRALHEPGAFGR
jgi:5-methylcytosine-specific restriction protein A